VEDHPLKFSERNLRRCEAPDEDLGDWAAEAGYTEDDVRKILVPAIKARVNGDS
jgi:hypothetical protein